MRTVLSSEAWAAAIDESLSDGVIAIQDGDGLWWRYPLAEFGG
jgi:hypothetical protein